jgi:hypothetical protein
MAETTSKAYAKLREQAVDELVQHDATSRECRRGILFVGQINDGPIISSEEERSERLLVELEDELHEGAETVLLDLANILRGEQGQDKVGRTTRKRDSRLGSAMPSARDEDRIR